MVLFKGEGFYLRSTCKDDSELKELINREEILLNMSEKRMYPQEMPSEIIFRIEKDSKLIGEVSLKSIKWFNRKAELSIFIAPEFQGQGMGKKALKLLMKHAFDTFNLHRLEAEVFEYNAASKKLIEELGFKLEGTLREARYYNGKYWDIFKYSILEYEFRDFQKQ
ncbi:hypothetical protein AT15_04725 [Kosmotoga arenicorallina S304]|uniref:N-acetyltransferase domain-containing protein n=1 Tax=Kosmotoga arenicorallina S304 TaxID=1453497 RepID=A0A176JWD5_9BACT|nr:GNAT family protein [Kosmotoga arenicorallina]OAA27995.1 hypothetical protein AT15_04725 [Kosmotoga arenicorallina S304]